MIDSTTIDRIREASELVTVIGETVELRPAGREFVGRCPFHDDTTPSLQLNPEKQRWFCHPCGKNGDVFRFVMERDKITFPGAVQLLARRAGIAVVEEPRRSRLSAGVTVSDFARAKGFDIDLLRALGITDGIWKGMPAVYFPYYLSGTDAAPPAVHIRRSLEKRGDLPRFEWRKGDSPIPYGLWCLPTSGVRKSGIVHLVEGESDFISLLQVNIPALGVPGNYWREDWSRYLEGIEKILVAVEADSGGERLVESLSRSTLWPRCQMMSFETLVPPLEAAVP